MTRDQQLMYCKVCTNRSFDAQLGIICKLTGRQADFVNACPSFSAEATAVVPSDNPYEFRSAVNVTVHTASTGQRFLNYLIDTVVYYLLIIVFVFVGGIAIALLAPDSLTDIDEESSGFTLLSYVIAILIMVGYYTFMESVFGRTIGKFITGTYVVTKDGKTPGTGTIFLRSLSRLVPFEAFSFLGDGARGWHDTWTDTWVITKPK
ncbi:MAG TPA: RDD family protein [Cyclobacteriaceae bacterium]|nr:RDD family protein [Cyclobacteriaceae bacterium]